MCLHHPGAEFPHKKGGREIFYNSPLKKRGRGIFKFPLIKGGRGIFKFPLKKEGQGDVPHRAEALYCYEFLICNMWLQPPAGMLFPYPYSFLSFSTICLPP